jgi:hypothetical protein
VIRVGLTKGPKPPASDALLCTLGLKSPAKTMVIGTAAEALKDLSEKSDQFAARELAEQIEREEREREERRLQAEVELFIFHY